MSEVSATVSPREQSAIRLAIGNATAIVPGLLLACGIAAMAFFPREGMGLNQVSPLIVALILGIVLRNGVGLPLIVQRGLAFAMRPVLRAGIVLLGLQLTLHDVLGIGMSALLVLTVTLVATLVFTISLGRALRVAPGLAMLIGTGSAVCGASAVVAANSVVQAGDEDVAYAVACVTLFGTASMVIMPALAPVLGMQPFAYGLWTGASIHEVAQVTGAAFAMGSEAGQVGTVAKLARVVMLAPVVFGLGLWVRSRIPQGADSPTARVPVPWFVLGFVAMVGIASTGNIASDARHLAGLVTQGFLAVALAAMGLNTRVATLFGRGLRPAMLAAAAWIFISLFGLVLVLMTA